MTRMNSMQGHPEPEPQPEPQPQPQPQPQPALCAQDRTGYAPHAGWPAGAGWAAKQQCAQVDLAGLCYGHPWYVTYGAAAADAARRAPRPLAPFPFPPAVAAKHETPIDPARRLWPSWSG